jgi:K+-transporting ATPase ATPase A chain
MTFETDENTKLTAAGANQQANSTQTGGNMEGKEPRFGPAASGLFAASTKATSTGAVDASHDSFTPPGLRALRVRVLTRPSGGQGAGRGPKAGDVSRAWAKG